MGDRSVTFIAALDIGTTTIKCHIVNSETETVASASTAVQLIYPKPGFVEINPDVFWNDIIGVVKQAIYNAHLKPGDIKCLAISTQRATFITWEKDTGIPFHNFITWKDMRAKDLIKEWNESLTFKCFRMGAYVIHKLTRNKRYLMGSGLYLTNTQVTGRLLWVIDNIPDVQENLRRQNVCFATIDTWLLHKFSGGKTFASDITNASSTGMYDPFILDWSSWPKQLMNIPPHIYPEVVDNNHDFGVTIKDVFGTEIPIKCMMADQQASMFGSGCFKINDLKVTLGTGSFLDMNTGQSPHGSLAGIYPLVAWKFGNNATYIAEAACNDTGSLIQWALNVGLMNNPYETSTLATNLADSDGVHFIPAFSGLGPPICDDKAASGFFGVKATSKKEHMVRAILESIVYRIILAYNVLKAETNAVYKEICVDGGVSKNDFVCQLLADISGQKVVRTATSEMSVLGVALVAGLNAGIWKNKSEVSDINKIERIFEPGKDANVKKRHLRNLREWMEVVERFRAWY